MKAEWVGSKVKAARPVREKALIINAFAPAGRFAFINPYTQGGAMGYELIGLSARIIGFWIYPSTTFFVLNPYNRHLTHPWLCVYWAFSSLCYVLIQPPSAIFPPQLKRSFKYDICIFDRSKLPVERARRRLARNSWVLRVQHRYYWYTDEYNDLCRECAINGMPKELHFMAKRPLLQRKRGRFVMQKGYSNNAKGAWLQCKRGFFALLNDNFRRAKKPLFMFWGDWSAFVDDKNRPWNL